MKVSSRRGLALGAMAALMISTIAQAAETTVADGKLTFSGYADMRYTNVTLEDEPAAVGDSNPQSGFGIEDGAFYSTYTKDNLSFVLDVPFRRFKKGDDSGTGGDANESNTNKILFGGDKAQIYANWKFNDAVSFAIGQMDTRFGVEVNDSKDRIFMKTGIVYDNMIPVTHTGVMFDYSNNGIMAHAFAANQSNHGSYGDNTSTANNTEYGDRLGWANDMWRAQFGYLTRSEQKTGAGTNEHDDRVLMDLIVGMTMDKLMVDVEYATLKSPNKDTLTTAAAPSAEATDEEDDGTGLLALVSYKLTDEFTAGVRYEMIDNDPAASGNFKEATAYGLAVHYNLSANMQLRGEYDTIDYKQKDATFGKDWTDKRFILGALASF
jgi:hypothetical protein